MKKYRIVPLPIGTLEVDKSFMMYFTDPGVPITIPTISFFIEGGEKNVLVDTGASAEIMKKHWPGPVSDVQSFEEALAKLSLKPEDIDIVIQTHLHFDHAGNITKCKNAKVIIQEEELRFALSPHPLFAPNYDLELMQGVNFHPVKGDTEIADGIKVMLTPGHSPGTQSVVVETTKGTAIIIGFCCIQQNFEIEPELKDMIPSWLVLTPGIHTDSLAAFDSALKIKGMADLLVPCHEPSLMQMNAIP
jgi:glyoxylase-like metal-dependent hydrolase (beta-lactamase superfamily II)